MYLKVKMNFNEIWGEEKTLQMLATWHIRSCNPELGHIVIHLSEGALVIDFFFVIQFIQQLLYNWIQKCQKWNEIA